MVDLTNKEKPDQPDQVRIESVNSSSARSYSFTSLIEEVTSSRKSMDSLEVMATFTISSKTSSDHSDLDSFFESDVNLFDRDSIFESEFHFWKESSYLDNTASTHFLPVR